jgi:beta-lactam-binding protein with PASTA domain
VVGLDPPVGTRVKSGHVLNVFVAVADLRTVPELVGKSDVEAMALLRTAELRPMFSKEPTSKYKPGIVLRQEPSAGTRVSPGSEVNVILATSMPRPPSEVPDVTGLPLEEAGAKLWTLASLAVRWDTKESARDRQGVVVSQSPGPGVQVRAGSEVTLTVAVTPNTCIRGYIWREAFPGDRVCVNPQTRVGAVDDNRSAGGRIERDPSKRHSGPDTCVQGLVWREARPGDHVCVVPEVRERTAEDNKTAASRIPRRLGPLPTAR